MEKGFLDKVEDNAAVRTWSETTQREKGDSLAKGYVLELWDFTRISVGQNGLQELKEIWEQWNDEKVDVFALSIYGLVVFPKALGHVDEAVTDLFDRLDKRVTPVPVILAETFRSLNACWKAGEGRFVGCTQLLLAWFHSHFWKVDKSLQEENIKWRALWLLPDEILYRCGDFDWVSLLGIWGPVGYAPLLVLRQYRLRQFIPTTQGLAECEFSYKCDGYKKKIREMSNAWNQTHRMKRLAVGPMATPEYNEWWVRRINDNIPGQVRKTVKLEKKIEQMEKEKRNLRLDMDVQKLKCKKLRKGKNKADEDLDSLKTDSKKLHLSMRTAELGKTLEQWH
ncbi:hypothetical protein Gotur_012794 [Gossypium turneri]